MKHPINFIAPSLELSLSIEDVFNPKEDSLHDWNIFNANTKVPPFTWESFFTAETAIKSIVLGEPGSGKSTLLKQVFLQAEYWGKGAVFIPLKTIDVSVESALDAAALIPTAYDGDLDEEKVYRTGIFDLHNDSSCIVCLDALDEVSEHRFNAVIDQIVVFCKRHPALSILISCRKHYLKHSHAKLRQLTEFTYISVDPFSTSQVEAFLKAELGDKATPEVLEAIMAKSRTNKNSSILSTPRYLKVFTDLFLDTPLDRILKMRRVDLFEKAIYHKLESNTSDRKGRKPQPSKPNEGLITKRVLEKLALVMEIYQKNQLSKEELVTFLDETDSNINLIFLNHLDIDQFITRVLKNIEDTLEFDNTEFQEYLAAKELLRLGKKSQILHDLIIEPTFHHIYRNWYDVLRYVIELDPPQLIPLLDHLNRKGQALVADDFLQLLTTVDETMLKDGEKQAIFESIFGYFQKSSFYLSYEQASKLTRFYVSAAQSALKTGLEQANGHRDFRKLQNIAITIGFLQEGRLLTAEEAAYWRTALTRLARRTLQPHLQIASLHALRTFMDFACLVPLAKAVKESTIAVQQAYLFSCCVVDSNHAHTLGLVVAYLKKHSAHAASLINSITGRNTLLALFHEMQQNDTLLLHVVRDFTSYYASNFDNIANVWDEEVETSTKQLLAYLLRKDRSDMYDASDFIQMLVRVLCLKQETYLYEFLRLIPEEALYAGYTVMLSEVLKPHLVEGFVQELSTTLHRRYLAKDVLARSKYADNPHRDEIYEAGRQYFPEDYKYWDQVNTGTATEDTQLQLIYTRFREELEPEAGQYNPAVFSTFYDHRASLYPIIQKAECDLLKKLLLTLFENVKPELFRVTITPVSENQKQVSLTNKYFYSFGMYIKIALELEMTDELEVYRSKFIRYLAIAPAADIEIILQHLGDLTEEDVHMLVDYCSGRSDDLLISSPRGFIKLVETVQRRELVPLLQAFVADSRLHPLEQQEALACLGEVFPDYLYLQHIFDIHSEEPGNSLAQTANAYLVSHFKDKAAIEWRFAQAKIQTQLKDRDGHGIQLAAWELESLHSSYFSCVINSIDPLFIPFVQDMLAYSIQIRKTERHLAYSNYLQRAAYLYYDNLKALDTYKHLKDLKLFLAPLGEKGLATGFEQSLRNLEISYIEHVGAPNNMADCVKRYNELKARTYLPISSAEDLRFVLEEVLNEDIETFIRQEGFYRPIASLAGAANPGSGKLTHVSEDTIQKTLKIQIENALLKRGFRGSDIIREAQLYDNKRLDLLVSYGFIGPVMLELKLLHNTEVTNPQERTAYKKKLRQYLEGAHASHGFYVLFNVRGEPAADQAFQYLQSEYKDLEALTVKKINCVI